MALSQHEFNLLCDNYVIWFHDYIQSEEPTTTDEVIKEEGVDLAWFDNVCLEDALGFTPHHDHEILYIRQFIPADTISVCDFEIRDEFLHDEECNLLSQARMATYDAFRRHITDLFNSKYVA
jgi:hypothetical protein